MISSIQLHEDVKFQLKNMKKPRESYEDVIARLIEGKKRDTKAREELLIQEYKEMYEELADEIKQINEDFKYADAEMDELWLGEEKST